MKTGIVILAAGESARMGEPKQLLIFHGETLLQHAIATALEFCETPVVVLGAHADEIRAQLDGTRILIAENPDWLDGMGGSLRLGLGALLRAHPEVSGVIFMPCDLPLLTDATLRDLIAAHESTGYGIAASEYAGVLGAPAYFSCEYFPELLTLDGTVGARQMIWRHRASAIGVPFPEGAMDMDTPSDYARLRESHRELSTHITV